MIAAKVKRAPRCTTPVTELRLPYPPHPRGEPCPTKNAAVQQFWLAVWFRERAELAAFTALAESCFVRAKRYRSDVLDSGVIGACIALEDREITALRNLRDAGGLLLAWDGTTALVQGGAQ